MRRRRRCRAGRIRVAGLAERREGVAAHGSEHREPVPQDHAPFARHVLGFDGTEARAAQQRLVAAEALQRRCRHPAPELLTLPVAQPRVGDPVGEGEPAAAREHPVHAARRGCSRVEQDYCLQAFELSESTHRARVGSHDGDPPRERRAGSARPPAALPVIARDEAAAAPVGQTRAGPGQPGADVEDSRGGRDAAGARGLDGGRPAVVVLVEVEESRPERPRCLPARRTPPITGLVIDAT